MGFIILLCGILAVVSGKPATNVITTTTLPSTKLNNAIVIQDFSSSTLPPPSEEPTTSGGTEEPRENAEITPPPPTDDAAPPVPLGPGSRFLYHIPISPDTDFRSKFWRFRDQPFYRDEAQFVPLFPYRRDKAGAVPEDGIGDKATPSENIAPVTEPNEEMRKETEAPSEAPTEEQEQTQESQVRDKTEMETGEPDGNVDNPPARNENFEDRGLGRFMIPLRSSGIDFLPFGDDRPSFRFISIPRGFSRGEDRTDVFHPEESEGQNPERFLEYDERRGMVPQEGDERLVGMIPMERGSFLEQPENHREEPEMIPSIDMRDQSAPNEEQPEGRAPEEEQPEGRAPEEEQPEGRAPEEEQPEGRAPEEEQPSDSDQQPQEQPQEQAQEQAQEQPSEQESSDVVNREGPGDRSMVEQDTPEENKQEENSEGRPDEQEQPMNMPPEMNREEDQQPPNEEEEIKMREGMISSLPEDRRDSLTNDEGMTNPMMPFQQNFDNSKWFEDPRPFYTNFNGDVPMNNMVENEMEVMRGNFDRRFA